MIYKLPAGDTTDAERSMLRKLRVWIAALALACLGVGIALGATLANLPAIVAQQSDANMTTSTTREVARAPEALSASFAEIARRVEPAVVKINTVAAATDVAAGETEGEDEEAAENKLAPDDKTTESNPLMELFRRQNRRPSVPRGIGSGFIVDSSGIIITNQHVVEGATRIKVHLQSGENLYGHVIGSDEETDIAVVRVETKKPLPVVKLGDSDAVEVGDWVLAIGSPFEFDRTVTAGIISTKERESPQSSLVRFLQTDAAINRGNSGGPLINMRGEVIGVNSQIATSTGDYNGIGFALPSNATSFVYRQLIAGGKVRRGYLGINLDTVHSEFASVYGLPEAKGAIVTNVREKGGPAAAAGIIPGDIIVEFNNQPVATSQDLIAKVAASAVGENVPVTYLRDTNMKLERRTTQVKIGERPPPISATLRGMTQDGRSAPKADDRDAARPRLGIKTSELTAQLVADLKLGNVRGLLVTEVTPGSIGDDAGLEVNMIIKRINRVAIATNADFRRVVETLKPGDPVVISVATATGTERSYETILQFTFQ
jgi:serine protease Do